MVDATVAPERRDFYVYMIFRPNGVPCYVGKGQGDRWRDHERDGERHRNPHFANILKKANGAELPKIKVAEDLSELEAFDIEIAFIAAIGRKVHGGSLVNMTDGGDGPAGWIPSPETRARIGAAGRGRKHTPEACAKIAASHTGSKRSEAARANMRAAQKGRVVTPEQRQKISETLKGRGPSPEHIAMLAKLNRGKKRPGRKLSAETRAKIGAAHLGQKRSDEAKAKMAKTWIGRKHSEETRAKMRASAKARWQSAKEPENLRS